MNDTSATTDAESAPPRYGRAHGLTIRAKLTVTWTVLLALVSAFLVVHIPRRMDAQSRSAIEARATSVAIVLSNAVAVGLEFDNETFVADQLSHLAETPQAIYAVVQRSDSTRLATWNDELVPELQVEPGSVPELLFFEDSLHVVARIESAGGSTGTLAVGFTLEELATKRREHQISGALVASGIFLVGFVLMSIVGSVIVDPLRRVTEAAQRITEGDQISFEALDMGAQPSWATSRDEARRLTSAIEAMHARITEEMAIAELERERAMAAESRAQLASKTKSSFLANMSHELRTPMNAIIGYSEMLREEAEEMGEAGWCDDLDKIRTAGTHLLALINDILDLSKVESGRIEFFYEKVEIAELLGEVQASTTPLIERKNNRLIIDAAEDLGRMVSDATRLRQCLFNLLSNAAKFTEDGTITLEARRDRSTGRDWLVFRVIDDGIGMTPEQSARIFLEFVQADASTTKKFGGTGLGLTISKHFAERLGGTLVVDSEVGRGTIFTLRLPAMAPGAFNSDVEPSEVSAIFEVPSAVAAAAAGATGTILVIEDDEDAQDLIRRMLELEGYQVQTVSTGEEGLKLARSIIPSAITLDVRLAGELDGWDVLTALKSDAELADVPVILVTLMDDRERGFSLGASDYLTKPIDRQRLLAAVSKYGTGTKAGLALIVDDEPNVRDLLTRTLRRAGWRSVEAENGIVALDRMRFAIPDVILLDLMMPEMDGFQFLEHLREGEGWAEVPVIVISAMELSDDDRTRLESTVQRILQKGSYSREELFLEIRARLKRTVGAA